MTRYFLTKVEIEGFRGINNSGDPLVLKFKPDAVNSVFASNGLGKSSVFDALSYAIRGHVPKLDALHAAEHADEYYGNRFHTSGNSVIVLTLTGDDGTGDVVVRIERSSDGTRSVSSPSGHPTPEDLLATLDGEFVLLDQSAFLQFVDDSPLHRGRTFSGLLGLSRLSEFRQALDVISNRRSVNSDLSISSLETEKTNAKRQADTALIQIRNAYRDLVGSTLPEPVDDSAVLACGSTALAGVELVKDFFDGKTLTQVDFDAVRQAIKQAEKGDLRDRLSKVIQGIQALKKLEPTDVESNEIETLETLISDRDVALSHTRGPRLATLYKSAVDVLKSDEWSESENCPVCESELSEPLLDQVEERLGHYEAVTVASKEIRNSWQSSAAVRRARELESSPQLGISEAERLIAGLDFKFRTGEPTSEDASEFDRRLKELEGFRVTKSEALVKEKEQLERELPPSLVELTQQVERADSLRRQINEHRQWVESLDFIVRKLSKRRKWQDFVKEAKDVFAESEVSLSTEKTTAIELEYRAMYAEITNNPEVVPRLRRSSGSEELLLRLEKFYGLDLNPA